METIVLIVLYGIITIGALIGIWRALKARGRFDPPRDPEKEPFFRFTLWAIVLAVTLLGALTDARAAAAQKPRRIVLSTDHCPPPADHYGPVLVFIIALSPDGHPLDYTCARIARNNYITPRRKPADNLAR